MNISFKKGTQRNIKLLLLLLALKVFIHILCCQVTITKDYTSILEKNVKYCHFLKYEKSPARLDWSFLVPYLLLLWSSHLPAQLWIKYDTQIWVKLADMQLKEHKAQVINRFA